MRLLSIKKLSVLLFATAFFFTPQKVWCDTVAPPCSYQRYSEDSKYFFIMLAPDDKREVECRGYSEEAKAEARKIRSKFSVSGLYSNKSPSKPLWKVNWYSYEVYVANNGKHLIRIGPWASSASDVCGQ